MTVGSGRNVLLGGTGSGTTIQAGSGDDVVIGPAAGGATITALGSSRIWGRGGHNTITGGNGSNIIDAGPGGNNVVTGNGTSDDHADWADAKLTVATGNGLSATYYNNADLTGTSVSRIDPAVNFNWQQASPVAGIAAGTFSARWTGLPISLPRSNRASARRSTALATMRCCSASGSVPDST